MEFCNALQHALIAPLLAPEWQCLWNGCCELGTVVSGIQGYMQALRRANLTGTSQFWLLDLSRMAFGNVLEKIRSLDAVAAPTHPRQKAARGTTCTGLPVQSYTDDLQRLVNLIELNKGWYGCLMCVRADPERCHKHTAGLVLEGLFSKPPPATAGVRDVSAWSNGAAVHKTQSTQPTQTNQVTEPVHARSKDRNSPPENSGNIIRRKVSKAPGPADQTGNRGSEAASLAESEATGPYAFDPEREPWQRGRGYER